MKDDVSISYLGSVWYAVLTSEAAEVNSPVVGALFLLLYISGHLSVTLKNTSWLLIAFQTFGDLRIPTLTFSRVHVPHPLSLVCTPGSRLLEQGGIFSCPQALWVLFPWFASLPSALTFCMKFPPSRLSSSGALLGPHRQTCRLLPSLLPSVVLTSLLEHVPRPALDDWVHLSFPSTTFTCLEAESVADSFPYPPAPDILSIRVSSPPIFEDMQR